MTDSSVPANVVGKEFSIETLSPNACPSLRTKKDGCLTAPTIHGVHANQGKTGATGLTFDIYACLSPDSNGDIGNVTVNYPTPGFTPTALTIMGTKIAAITATVDIDASIQTGADAISINQDVEGCSQSSNALPFFVTPAIPTYFGPTGASPGPGGCGTGAGGMFYTVHYQVLDQDGAAMAVSGITPQEHVTRGGTGQPGWHLFSTPLTTFSDGKFDDDPVGTCFGPPKPEGNPCVSVTQDFQAILNVPLPLESVSHN